MRNSVVDLLDLQVQGIHDEFSKKGALDHGDPVVWSVISIKDRIGLSIMAVYFPVKTLL